MLAKYCTSRSSLSYCFGRPVFLFSLFNARILPILHQLIKKQDTPSKWHDSSPTYKDAKANVKQTRKKLSSFSNNRNNL
jgi:hypothetical protein